jgi:hypothetical protein
MHSQPLDRRPQAYGFVALTRDPGLFAVIAIIIVAIIILPNPFDQEGAIDAFIYNAYSLNFSNLINRYGPWYFSYRIAHFSWLWLARALFGYDFSQKALAAIYLSTIAASTWIIIRPYLSRFGALGLTVLIVLSPWTIKTVATSYLDATCASYMFVLTALLILNKRAGWADLSVSFAAGCVFGLIVNANTYLVVFGCLIFIAHFAVALERRTISLLFRSGAVAVLGFIVTQAILWLTWSGILVIGSGTPIAAILRWTWISLQGSAWDADMFSIAVGTAMAHLLTADPRPFVWRMFYDGEVRVVFPLAMVLSIVAYRLWNTYELNSVNHADRRGQREEWDSVVLSAVLIVSYCYVTSESGGNQMLSAPFYFVYMLPGVYLSAALTVSYAWQADSSGRFLGCIIFAAVIATIFYMACTFVPSETLSTFIKPGVGTKIAWALIMLAIIMPLPLWRPASAGTLILALVLTGNFIFLASSSGYYRIPYSKDMNLVSRDILNAQVSLINFVERTAPPPGVSPNSHPVIFWYPNSQFAFSLASTYLEGYQSLHGGHGQPALPHLEERGITQLKAGYRREIVFLTTDKSELQAAEKAFHDLGVEFDVIGNASFAGVKRSIQFTYIRVTKPPS